MRRREFLSLVGGAAAGWPLAARAQQRMPVVGCINGGSPATHAERMRIFRQGLGEMGYVDGKNVAIEYRWAGDDFSLFPALAADLVGRKVNVIVVGNLQGTQAVQAATTTIPIVFTMGGDPIKLGFVASLNKPGGNITGITTMGLELEPKRLELARELLPSAKSSALLINPAAATASIIVKSAQMAASKLGLELQILHASAGRDLEPVFTNFSKLGAGALVIGNDGVFIGRVGELGEPSVRHAVPAIFQFREFAAAGGLMSYGGTLTEQHRLAGIYVGRILKGEKPADLPVQQETKVELIVNLKTAKALGLTVPSSVLARADEVIE